MDKIKILKVKKIAAGEVKPGDILIAPTVRPAGFGEVGLVARNEFPKTSLSLCIDHQAIEREPGDIVEVAEEIVRDGEFCRRRMAEVERLGVIEKRVAFEAPATLFEGTV